MKGVYRCECECLAMAVETNNKAIDRVPEDSRRVAVGCF